LQLTSSTRKKRRIGNLFVGLAIALVMASGTAVAADLTINADSAEAGWQDWSWDATVGFDAASPEHLGSHAIAVACPAGRAAFYLQADDVTPIAKIGPASAPGAGPLLSINVSAGRHAISEAIYGMNFADEALSADLRLPVRRSGGNATTRYNWQNDTANTGWDWFFENVPESNPNPATLPDGSAADRFVEQDRRTATKTLMTVPLIGWSPKRRPQGHPYDCGFKVSNYGPQQSTDFWDADCGNGQYADGSDVTGNDPADTSIAIGPAFVAAWIDHLVGRYGTAAEGGVAYYDLDNEPMLWNHTHRDVHPQATTYEELRDRTCQYAAAIKAVDPSAQTLGPVAWGWCAYFYSAADGCSSSGSDYQAHGGTAFVPWYLQQMKAYEQQHGVRILDYVDLHIYPQIDGVYSESPGDADIQAKRLSSTRQLWDPTYVHEGWIGQPVYLIPRMQQWVADNYPGTKTAISEYNWGALGYLNGALAQADILGIFGREGLDLATLWDPPTADQPGAFAFRIYRNYDGAGHGFGDVSVQAASADQGALSVYAAQRSTDRAITVVVINKTPESLTSAVSLSGFAPASTAAVYRYSAADLNSIERLADQSVAGSGFNAPFPGNSISLFVMTPSGAQPDTPPAAPSGLTVN
jgi:Glycoside hydrolase family 44